MTRGLDVWLYSSDDAELNFQMDEDLYASLLRTHPHLTFLSSHKYTAESHFELFHERFSRFGYCHTSLLSPDLPFSQSQLSKALRSDLIYLDGGNTYYFLDALRKAKLLPSLKEFVKKGGVLAGSSAGAIILTPNINTASYPASDHDENEMGMEDLTALGVVGFEFYPHWVDQTAYNDALLEQSELIDVPIYGAPDGGGVRSHAGRLTFYGDVHAFVDGSKIRLNPFH